MTRSRAAPPAPECGRLLEVRETSQAIGRFLDWLTEEKKIVLAKRAGEVYSTKELFDECIRGDDLVHIAVFPEKLLAEYFKIDLKKVEEERRGLLDWMMQEAQP